MRGSVPAAGPLTSRAGYDEVRQCIADLARVPEPRTSGAAFRDTSLKQLIEIGEEVLAQVARHDARHENRMRPGGLTMTTNRPRPA